MRASSSIDCDPPRSSSSASRRSTAQSQAQPVEPLRYTFRVVDAAKHIAEIEARIPSSGQPSLDLMMPVWTPGFYRVEDYAARVQSLVAKTPDGVTLDVTKPTPNRWQVATNGSAGRRRDLPPALPGTVGHDQLGGRQPWRDQRRGHVHHAWPTGRRARTTSVIELPPTWQASCSGLEPAPGRAAEPLSRRRFRHARRLPHRRRHPRHVRAVRRRRLDPRHRRCGRLSGLGRSPGGEGSREDGPRDAQVLGLPAVQALRVPQCLPAGRRRPRALELDAAHLEPQSPRSRRRGGSRLSRTSTSTPSTSSGCGRSSSARSTTRTRRPRRACGSRKARRRIWAT